MTGVQTCALPIYTGFIYLVGKDGRYLGFLPPGSTPDAIADAIRARLGP